MARLSLSAPWVLFYHEVEAFFKKDPDVRVVFDEDNMDLKLYVNSSNKAAALDVLIVKEKDFGSTKLNVTIMPPNNTQLNLTKTANNVKPSMLFRAALVGNGNYDYVEEVIGIFTSPIYYVVFTKEVVQYFTDDLGDINGIKSTLSQEIAKNIFVTLDGVHYCTSTGHDAVENRVPYFNNVPTPSYYGVIDD